MTEAGTGGSGASRSRNAGRTSNARTRAVPARRATPARTVARAQTVAPASTSAQALAVTLREAGIRTAPGAFLDMVREALAGLRTKPAVDPRSQFSEAEVAALERGGFDLRPPGRAGQAVLARTAAEYVAMLDDALSVAQAAKRLRVDQSRIRQLLSNGSLYGVKVRGEWRLPTFQFTARGTVPGIQEPLRALPGDLHPIAVLEWFRNPDPDLEIEDDPVSPLDWLRSGGDPARVSAIAADL
jgi:excisionase family DNA binding protein